MLRPPNRLGMAMALVLALVTPRAALAQGRETIIEWNRILLASMGTPGVLDATVFFTRPPAVMNVAIFEAMNSITPAYMAYVDRLPVTAGASPDAAAAQAAHDVLVGMFPSQQSVYDAALAAQLNRIPGAAAEAGARVGAAAARAILSLRANDGWNRRPSEYILPSVAGFWQPVPPQNTAAAFTHYPDVMPFVIGHARQFLVGPPPSLTSAAYAADFNEAKAIGSATSTTRTAEQTLIARLFAGLAPATTYSVPLMWNVLMRDLAQERGLSALETARFFALTNMAWHDALHVSFYGKYLYGFWRPTTAIREAARDGNAATEADPNWLSLIPSPPYPTYPGNYACASGAMTRIFERVFGRDNIPLSMTWATPDGGTIRRSYNGFRQLADEAARSRVYGGIHFNFDSTASLGVCIPLADYVFENVLRPRLP
ncbi:MAG: vanadium-dependent haloperoxidase [Vicinamibacterales bacterium]